MYAIHANFERFENVSFGAVLRNTGVYVIWDSQARARPSYIGEGDLLSRLSTHDSRFAFPVRGYIALIGSTGRKIEKQNARVLEALLLAVAEDTDRWPTHNKNPGHRTLIGRIYDNYGLVKGTIRGCDPFAPPWAPRKLEDSKNIWVELDRDGYADVQHHWNHRKRLLH